MPKIHGIKKLTENPFVNLYHLQVENRKGNPGSYYVASRAKTLQELELNTKKQSPDLQSLRGECGPGCAGSPVSVFY